MKTRRLKKKLTQRVVLLAAIRLLLSATAMAATGPSLEDLSHMRLKQQNEEGSVVRVIQQPLVVQNGTSCAPVELSRQRLRDVDKEEKFLGTVNVEAGHGEVSIEGNSGQINNSVNVQVVNPNDRKCF